MRSHEMNNSSSRYASEEERGSNSFLIESEEEEEEDEEAHPHSSILLKDADSDSDSSSDDSSCATPRPSSYATHQWPQSYRQSIDIYSSVQSPNLSFLGTPTLSRLSNSFLTNSFRGKTPEILSNLVKPLLRPSSSSDDQQQQQQHDDDTRKSSQYLLPSRKPSLQQIPEDQKPLVPAHEVPAYQQCSYTQAVMNGLVMALVGSLLTMLVTYILPCACFLAILKRKVTWHQIAACSFIIVVGVCCACVGTYSSLSKIIQNYT
uniref:Amino acid transporter transmembrane domain-containing protein n=1 Tax=Oryza glumipatula TaxID=40148 RepID=A0A0D9YKY5_9ORYZ